MTGEKTRFKVTIGTVMFSRSLKGQNQMSPNI